MLKTPLLHKGALVTREASVVRAPPLPAHGIRPVLMVATAWEWGLLCPPCYQCLLCHLSPVPTPVIYYRVPLMVGVGAELFPASSTPVVTSPPVLNKVRVGVSVWVQVCVQGGTGGAPAWACSPQNGPIPLCEMIHPSSSMFSV